MNHNLNQEYQKNFEDFRKIRDLNTGPHGTVSLCEDPSDQSQVAIKTLYQTDTNDNEVSQQFHNEVQALINLQHSCILPIVGYSSPSPRTETELPKPPQIATKYAQNGSLKDILGKIESGQTPAFVDDTWITTAIGSIILGMQFIHSNHYIHRDLKPGNILVDDQGNVLIGDLGSSKFVDLQITYTKMVGSPFYMAPEMYDEGQYTNSVDVYSFALILYELLVKRPVFPRNMQPLPLMRRVCDGTRPELPEDLHPQIRDIIQKCWDVSPENRYTFDEIYQKLEDINFQITPNVDSERVKSVLSGKSQIRVNVHLLDGEIYPMVLSPEDDHISFRRRIGLHANLPLELVIPSINGNSISCCYGCNLGERPLLLKDLVKIWSNITGRHNDFDIDLLYEINATYCPLEDSIPTTITKFFMKPGSISDMFKQITNPCRNLWFLNNCNLRVYLDGEELHPSDETMIEKGITTGCELTVERILDAEVTIVDQRFLCNLDDPIEELLWRYLKVGRVVINNFVYLEKNGAPIDRSLTLREAGIVDNDVLSLGYDTSEHEVQVTIDNISGRISIPPNSTFRNFKWNALFAIKSDIPIGTMDLFPRTLVVSDDSIVDSNITRYSFIKAFKYRYPEYRQY